MIKVNNLIKKCIVFIHDIMMIPIAWYLSYWLRFNFDTIPYKQFKHASEVVLLVMIVQIICYRIFGLYRGIWRFSSIPDLFRIFKSVILSMLIIAVFLFLYDRLTGIPRSVLVIYSIVLILLLGGSRFIYRWFKDYSGVIFNGSKVLIIGSGKESEALIRSFRYEAKNDYRVIALLTKDPSRIGREIQGVRVVGEYSDFEYVIKKYGVNLVVIAAQDADSNIICEIVSYCDIENIQYRVLPTMSQLALGKVSVSDLREVAIEDLLGRKEVHLDQTAISQSILDQKVMITGGGGSIGSELCRQIANYNPQKIIIIENSEYNLYLIEMELSNKFPKSEVVTYLSDVTDAKNIAYIFDLEKPDLVFHAAAYKHVPLLEHNVDSAVINNISGTGVVAKAAITAKVKKFILISTDKAVNPTNVMGATKRAAEMLCQSLNAQSTTKFIIVRFGNVLGSRGSVLPLFRKQLKAGGPITVTHPEIERFFMTIPEACQLILQAMELGNGGEIFVLDMGKPIKIRYLAEQMIKLAGKKVGEDIKIVYSGLRPGEKLYEELFYQSEQQMPTKHQKIFRSSNVDLDSDMILNQYQHLINAALKANQASIKELLLKLVPEFHISS